MRAIDADRLQKQFDKKSTNPNYRVNMHNIKSIITNAPTVDAIPRERIEQMVAEIEQQYAMFKLKTSPMSILDIIHKYTKEQNNEQTI